MYWCVLFICRMKAYREQNVNVRRNQKNEEKVKGKLCREAKREHHRFSTIHVLPFAGNCID